MERNILSQTTHKIMYYVIMCVYRVLQFINYIVKEHTTIKKSIDTGHTQKIMHYVYTHRHLQ